MRHATLLVLTMTWLAMAADAAPPPFPPGDTVTDYAGVTVADPYRALEHMDDPKVRDWVAAQAAYTREMLDAIPGRAALLRETTRLDQRRAPQIQSLRTSDDGSWFYLKREPGGRSFKLYTRRRGQGPERLLLDPEAWERETGQPHAINNFSVAPDGRHLAAVVSVADAELGELRLIETATGRQVRPPVPKIWGELVASWLPDSQAVVYAQGAGALDGGEPFGKQRLLRRTLTDGPDVLWLGHGAGFGPEVRDTDWVALDTANADGDVIAYLSQGVAGDVRAWAAPREALMRDPAHAPWRLLFDERAQVRAATVSGHWLYARSYGDAPRYRLLRLDLTQPDQGLQPAVDQREGVIDDPVATADGLYFLERHGANAELLRLPHGAPPSAIRPVALPFAGAPTPFDANARRPGLFYALEGWTRPRTLLRTENFRSRDTGLIPADRSGVGRDWVATEAGCPTADGQQVPMSIIHRRGLVRDHLRPLILDGYGGYGLPEPAYFNRRLEAFFRRGGVWVDVKPRGGGAKGRDWYQQGVGPNKANTWRDMLACAQAVIDLGYTQPARLGILGTSMGGVAVGRAITERPDLFAVALVRVGITDAVRFVEATQNGPNHELEMGTVKTEAGIRQLLAMSTYHQIRDGQRYPATLFTTGLNDSRVAPWIVFKTFARLSAAALPGRPVLLRVDDAGGHGVSTTGQQRNAEWADLLTFMLWNTDQKGFQPR